MLIYPFCAFRFHTGSIKRKMSAKKRTFVIWFRFHTGSIKRMITPKDRHIPTGFDSILVRLKENSSLLHQDVDPEFRFHTGSIKRKILQSVQNRS